VILYDGSSGDKIAELDGHKGSVLAIAWGPDSKSFATAGADGTVRIWSAESKSQTGICTIGTDVSSQQVGIAWTKVGIVSLSLSGTLSIIDPAESKVSRVIVGPQKAITALAQLHTTGPALLYTGSYDGRVFQWTEAFGTGKLVEGPSPHTNQVVGLAVNKEGRVKSIAMDDTLKEIDASSNTWT